MEDKVYVAMVSDAIVEAVVRANDRQVQVKACVGSGHEDKVAFNRRYHMKNGQTWTHPSGFRTNTNKDILKSAGPRRQTFSKEVLGAGGGVETRLNQVVAGAHVVLATRLAVRDRRPAGVADMTMRSGHTGCHHCDGPSHSPIQWIAKSGASEKPL